MHGWGEMPKQHVISRRFSHIGAVDVNVGCEYTNEELCFMRALDSYKRKYQRPFPTCTDVLKVLKSLGYRKIMPECTIEEVNLL